MLRQESLRILPPFKIEIKYFAKEWPRDLLISVEAPISEVILESFSVEVRGLISRRVGCILTKPKRLEFIVDNVILWSTPIELSRPDIFVKMDDENINPPMDENCGFNTVLPTFLSASVSPIVINVVCERGEENKDYRFRLGEIAFYTQTSSIISAPSALKVIGVTSIGRSGSSLLCRLLNEHAFCIAPKLMGQFGEVSILGYYLRAIAVLSSEGALSEMNKFEDKVDFLSLPISYLKLDNFQEEYESKLDSRVQKIVTKTTIGLFNEILDEINNYIQNVKPGAEYWIEKNWNAASFNLGHSLVREWREIILIRDIRTFWYSQIRFHRKIQTENRQIAAHVQGTFDKYLALIASYLDRKSRCLLVKYEDLIGDSEKEMMRVGRYLDLPINQPYLNKVKSIINSDDSIHMAIQSQKSPVGEELDFDAYINSFEKDKINHLKSLLSFVGYSL